MSEVRSAASDGHQLAAIDLDIDPFARDFVNDPYPYHDTLREIGPAFFLGKYGIWGIARYAEVRSAFEDWQTFSSAYGVGFSNFRKEKPWRPPSIISEADPPLHTQSRSALMKVLSPPAMRKLKQKFMEEATNLVDLLLNKQEFDVITDLAEVYVGKMMGDTLGIPVEGRKEHLIKYGRMAVATFAPRNWIFEEIVCDPQPTLEWIAGCCERSSLAPGGFGEQIYQASDRGEIPTDHAKLLVRSLLTAGIDNVVLSLGNTILALARHPAQWKMLRDDPSLWRSAFDETLRYESPVQLFFRTTERPANVGGIEIPTGEKVVLFMGAANRDPRKWTNPNEFNIRRDTQGHLGLGGGIHACVGQMMARLEAECILSAFLKRVISMELTGEPVAQPNSNTKGYASVPVRVTLQ